MLRLAYPSLGVGYLSDRFYTIWKCESQKLPKEVQRNNPSAYCAHVKVCILSGTVRVISQANKQRLSILRVLGQVQFNHRKWNVGSTKL